MFIRNISQGMGIWTEGERKRFLSYFISPLLDIPVENIAIGMVVVPPHVEPDLHMHDLADEFWFIIEGSGKMQIGDEIKPVKSGDIIFGPRLTAHRIINDTEDTQLKALFILSPNGDEKDVIQKIKQEGVML